MIAVIFGVFACSPLDAAGDGPITRKDYDVSNSSRLSKAAAARAAASAKADLRAKMLATAGARYRASLDDAAEAMHSAGSAMLAALDYGATHSDVAAACGIRCNSAGKCPALSNILRAMRLYPIAPKDSGGVARFLAYWHGNGARHDAAASGPAASGGRPADLLTRLGVLVGRMAPEYGAADVMMEVHRHYTLDDIRRAVATLERIDSENADAAAEAAESVRVDDAEPLALPPAESAPRASKRAVALAA